MLSFDRVVLPARMFALPFATYDRATLDSLVERRAGPATFDNECRRGITALS
jgi:hypothetical protein